MNKYFLGSFFKFGLRGLLILFSFLFPQFVRAEVVLEQILSREHPHFSRTGDGLAVTKGHVYLFGGKDGKGYVLRISKDGKEKFGGQTAYAITGVAANEQGIIATSNAHFSKAVHIYDNRFHLLGQAEGFTGNDSVGWDSPGSIEVGPSGDFYALDQHVNRVVRVGPDGRVVRTYPIRTEGEADRGKFWSNGFRICEAREQFLFLYGNTFICVGFDGKTRWKLPGWNPGNPWDGYRGGFDFDGEGRLFLCEPGKRTIAIFDAQGKSAGKLDLPGKENITHLRVSGNEMVIRHKSATELFRRYSLKDGTDLGGASIAFEKLVVRYPSHIWIEGEETPFEMDFKASGKARPNLGVWIRPLGEVIFTKLSQGNGKIQAPKKGGLYHLRITAGLEGGESEYLLQSVVEVRPANAIGSVSILTPLNRVFYALGEKITGKVVVRAKADVSLPNSMELRMGDARQTVQLEKGLGSFNWSFPLKVGEHRLTTDLPGFTIADQKIIIGDPFQSPAFHLTQHGDYGSAFPNAAFYDAPEKVAIQLKQAKKLSLNTFVERLGHGAALGYHGVMSGPLHESELSQRLEKDPIAISPFKAEFAHPVMQTLAGYGAEGIETRGILLYMDAGLPLGTGFDRRKPDEMKKAVAEVTARLKDSPSFRGWSWAANWWIEKRGTGMASSPEEKTAYESAMKEANKTGKWSGVLETVSDRWIAHAIEAEKILRPASPGKISAMTAPYRQPGFHPPLTFAHADEVDLHWQAEQIQWPRIAGHNVDFYRRPGKPAWAHPELWNDDGTGGLILSHSLELVMRGAHGIGQSGSVKGFGSEPTDPRGTGPGATSIHRALNHLLGSGLGKQLAEAKRIDPIVIPVSTRMMRLELDWKGVGGFYFTRLYEAYNACAHAHRPARFVFVEDLKPDSFRDAKAVLVVSQTVELEPALQNALKQCGLPIYADASCRTGIVLGAKALDIAFNLIEKEHHVLNDDSAFPHFRNLFLNHAKKLHHHWGQEVPPLVECKNPEILFTECRLGDRRFLIAVNDTLVPLETGQMWRVSLHCGNRLPVREKIQWSGKEWDVDLRTRPWGIFAAPGSELSKEMQSANSTPFGPHFRDLAISADGKTALLTAAGWDRNFFMLDLSQNQLKGQGKIGHHYAYAPTANGEGFFAQGYDLTTPEGYHLYRLDEGGKTERRFALYGYPNRGTSWANSRQWQEPAEHFAAAQDGSWVASAGNLGLAVWDQQGKLLWSRDDWKTERISRRIFPAGAKVLISLSGAKMTAYEAVTGKEITSVILGETGLLTRGITNADGSILALVSTAEGGRVYIVQNGKNVNTLAIHADDLALSPDGNTLAVTKGNQLHLLDPLAGLLWSFTGEDVLRTPRFSPEGQRIAVGSELGTLTVHQVDGKRLFQHDYKAWPIPAWLPDGGLLVANWTGGVTRLNREYIVVSQLQLQPDSAASAADLTRVDSIPTARIDNATNALDQPLPLTPNLLKETQALIDVRFEPKVHGDPRPWQHKIADMIDGDPKAPDSPWLEWSDINYIDSGWRGKLTLHMDTFRTQIRLEAITFIEDPKHPESWLRDCRLEYWDAKAAKWRPGPYFLSNQAKHSHRLEKPVEAAKFRLVSSGGGSWPVGNLRLGELVFHGKILGPSHPDAVENRKVAVLFDEREEDLKAMMAEPLRPFAFYYADAYSGGKSLALIKPGESVAHWQPPFGHCIPGWDFEIVEKPQKAGEYRYLQFAWKRLSSKTTGIALGVGPGHTGGFLLTAGETFKLEGAKPTPQNKKVPDDWEAIRVDLWKMNGGAPYRIRSLTLGAMGDGALFDQILLGRSEADLKTVQRLKR